MSSRHYNAVDRMRRDEFLRYNEEEKIESNSNTEGFVSSSVYPGYHGFVCCRCEEAVVNVYATAQHHSERRKKKNDTTIEWQYLRTKVRDDIGTNSYPATRDEDHVEYATILCPLLLPLQCHTHHHDRSILRS